MKIKKDKQYIIYTNNKGNQYSFDINNGIWTNIKTQKELKINTPPCFMKECYCKGWCEIYPTKKIDNISIRNILKVLSDVRAEDRDRQDYLLIADKLGAVNIIMNRVCTISDMLQQFETVEKFLKYCTKNSIEIANTVLDEVLRRAELSKKDEYIALWGIPNTQNYSASEIVGHILNQNYNTSPYFNLIKKWIKCDRIFEIMRSHDVISEINRVIKMFDETQLIDSKTNFYHLVIMAMDWEKENKSKRFYEKAIRNEDKLFFETDEFITVIPHSVEDMLKEGGQQHNCVGRVYVDNVIEEYSNIVFIRRKNSIDKSFITCEVCNDGLISQFLKAYNKLVTQDDTECYEFRKAYQEHLYKTFCR